MAWGANIGNGNSLQLLQKKALILISNLNHMYMYIAHTEPICKNFIVIVIVIVIVIITIVLLLFDNLKTNTDRF